MSDENDENAVVGSMPNFESGLEFKIDISDMSTFHSSRPARTIAMSGQLLAALQNCLATTQIDITSLDAALSNLQSMSPSPEALESSHAEKISISEQLLAAQAYAKRLKARINSVESLSNRYKQTIHLVNAALQGRRFSAGKTAASSSANIKALDKRLVALETQIEARLGDIKCDIRGLAGFSRICAGDQFEVTFKHGQKQKWRARVKVGKDDSQTWTPRQPSMAMHTLIDYSLDIKVCELKSGATRRVTLGTQHCDAVYLLSANPQIMTISVNQFGSLQLHVIVSWGPLAPRPELTGDSSSRKASATPQIDLWDVQENDDDDDEEGIDGEQADPSFLPITLTDHRPSQAPPPSETWSRRVRRSIFGSISGSTPLPDNLPRGRAHSSASSLASRTTRSLRAASYESSTLQRGIRESTARLLAQKPVVPQMVGVDYTKMLGGGGDSLRSMSPHSTLPDNSSLATFDANMSMLGWSASMANGYSSALLSQQDASHISTIRDLVHDLADLQKSPTPSRVSRRPSHPRRVWEMWQNDSGSRKPSPKLRARTLDAEYYMTIEDAKASDERRTRSKSPRRSQQVDADVYDTSLAVRRVSEVGQTSFRSSPAPPKRQSVEPRVVLNLNQEVCDLKTELSRCRAVLVEWKGKPETMQLDIALRSLLSILTPPRPQLAPSTVAKSIAVTPGGQLRASMRKKRRLPSATFDPTSNGAALRVHVSPSTITQPIRGLDSGVSTGSSDSNSPRSSTPNHMGLPRTLADAFSVLLFSATQTVTQLSMRTSLATGQPKTKLCCQLDALALQIKNLASLPSVHHYTLEQVRVASEGFHHDLTNFWYACLDEFESRSNRDDDDDDALPVLSLKWSLISRVLRKYLGGDNEKRWHETGREFISIETVFGQILLEVLGLPSFSPRPPLPFTGDPSVCLTQLAAWLSCQSVPNGDSVILQAVDKVAFRLARAESILSREGTSPIVTKALTLSKQEFEQFPSQRIFKNSPSSIWLPIVAACKLLGSNSTPKPSILSELFSSAADYCKSESLVEVFREVLTSQPQPSIRKFVCQALPHVIKRFCPPSIETTMLSKQLTTISGDLTEEMATVRLAAKQAVTGIDWSGDNAAPTMYRDAKDGSIVYML